eukprot:Rmarinus@m.12121
MVEDHREIGDQGVWTLSTAKPGNGVEHLRDGDMDTYWQSDGHLPHFLNIQFYKKMKIQDVALYMDFKRDESYTPSKVSVRIGNDFQDLDELRAVEVEEPTGWVLINLNDPATSRPYVRAFLLQIVVHTNHQNGRDSHIRQIKLYGPPSENSHKSKPLKSVEYTMFEGVR